MKGFTLIELMLVIIIIGILAGVAIPRFVGKSEKARVAAAEAGINAFGLCLDMFELDNGRYPSTEQGLQALLKRPETIPELESWDGPYIQRKRRMFEDPWRHPYVYKCPGDSNPEGYDLSSYGPDGEEGGGDDITAW